ncbi:hypothetical protein ACFL34_04975, partial [Candidatus Sumerlaeota bacterium]
ETAVVPYSSKRSPLVRGRLAAESRGDNRPYQKPAVLTSPANTVLLLARGRLALATSQYA